MWPCSGCFVSFPLLLHPWEESEDCGRDEARADADLSFEEFFEGKEGREIVRDPLIFFLFLPLRSHFFTFGHRIFLGVGVVGDTFLSKRS